MLLEDLAAAAVGDKIDTAELPDIIPGSECQLDADISCYYVGWTDIPLGKCIELLKKHIEIKRLMLGCEIINTHTTHGNKSGRNKIAMVNMYQDERKKHKDEEKSARIKELRQFLQTYESETVKPHPQFEIEADDSMAIRQRECIAEGKYSVICTKDKDLSMCIGNQVDYDEMEVFEVPDAYGELWMEEWKVPAKTKSGFSIKKKLKGRGTAFFWAQLLMGDSADSIPGCPSISGRLLNKYVPTKGIETAFQMVAQGTVAQRRAAERTLAGRKKSTIGQVTAYEILRHVTNDKDAMKVCMEFYKEHYGEGEFEFETWRGDIITTTAGNMLYEQAQLLWMLRYRDDNVINFFRERCR